jgi:hypothetical protein
MIIITPANAMNPVAQQLAVAPRPSDPQSDVVCSVIAATSNLLS